MKVYQKSVAVQVELDLKRVARKQPHMEREQEARQYEAPPAGYIVRIDLRIDIAN